MSAINVDTRIEIGVPPGAHRSLYVTASIKFSASRFAGDVPVASDDPRIAAAIAEAIECLRESVKEWIARTP